MEIELEFHRIPFVARKALKLTYRERVLRARYVPDFICEGKFIVELKAVTELTDEHRAQVHNYLKATGYQLGLLVNFGHYPKAQIERIAVSRGRYEAGR
jgi:GxxExxY protein